VWAQQATREQWDAEVDELRDKYQKTLDRLKERLSREEQGLARDRADYEGRKREELLSAGETVVGMLGIFGRRSSRGLSTAARKRRLTTKALADEWTDVAEEVEVYSLKPRRKDVKVELVTLAWAPFWEISYGSARGKVAHSRVAAY